MRKYFLYLAVFCGFYFVLPHTSNAALLYFDPVEASIHRGDSIGISLRLDTDENECINTVDAVIRYDESIRAVDVSRGDSILNLWVEPPVIDEVNRTITFAGGIPGGYCGRILGDPSLTNVLLKLVFRSPGLSIGTKGASQPRIWIEDGAQVLLHDGFGTNAQVRLQDSKIALLDTPGGQVVDDWTTEVQDDKELPAEFSIILARDESAFSGKYFITFNSLDKQSGIDHYEVMEESSSDFNAFKWGRADAPWHVTESPYVLKDQTLNSTIRVKVIDKAGNERIAVLVPDEALRRISLDAMLLIGIVGGVVVLISVLIVYALWRRKKIVNQTIDSHYE
jgi:hypothetical protein